MLLAKYHLRPRPHHPDYSRVGYALACVFVDCDDAEAADARATTYLQEHGWEIQARGPVSRMRADADRLGAADTQQWVAAARQWGICAWIQAVPREAENREPMS